MRTTSDEPRGHHAGQMRRVLGASLIGTTTEWYDVFIYASAASLVFGKLGQRDAAAR